MKIVNRKEFLKTPEMTLFRRMPEEGLFGNFEVKTSGPDDYGNDFVSFSFDWPKGAYDTASLLDIEDRILEGNEFRIDYTATVRDGLFNDKEMFMVYDKQDVKELIDALFDCL